MVWGKKGNKNRGPPLLQGDSGESRRRLWGRSGRDLAVVVDHDLFIGFRGGVTYSGQQGENDVPYREKKSNRTQAKGGENLGPRPM